MVVVVAPDYPALFRQQSLWAAHHVLGEIRAHPVARPETTTQAFHLLGYLFPQREAWPETRALLLALAPPLEQAGLRHEWLPFLARGIQRSQEEADLSTEAWLRFHLGVLHHHRAEYEAAWQHFVASLTAFEQLPEALGRARSLTRLADTARHQHRPAEATRLAEEALALPALADAEAGYALYVLGGVALDERAWEQAEQLFRRALERWQGTTEPRMQAWGLANLGASLRALERYDEATACYQRALHLFDSVHDPVHRAVVQMNLGNVYLNQDRPEDALRAYYQAVDTFQQSEARERLGMLYNNMGLAYYQQQKWREARGAFEESVRLWTHLENPRALANVLDGLGLVLLAQGERAGAAATFRDALAQLEPLPESPALAALRSALEEHLREALSDG